MAGHSAFGGDQHEVGGVVGAAPLPGGSGHVGGGVDQARVGVAGHQAHAGEASGDQVSEELLPGWSGLAGGHAYAQYFAVSIVVEPGGNQDRARDDASSFPDFHGQARLRRWRSHCGKYMPVYSLGIATSIVPALVSKGGWWRYPLRWA